MKKVKYMIGALGVAPALGMLMPAGNAAAAVTHAAGKAAKTVSLAHAKTATAAAINCSPSNSRGGGVPSFAWSVFYSKDTCVSYDYGLLSAGQTGLYMRTRLYENGVQYQGPLVEGSISPFGNITTWSLVGIERKATKACGALVYENNTAKVAYGPVCANI